VTPGVQRRVHLPVNILLLKPSSLGDVVQALPVLRLLRLRFPGAAIHWWISAELSPLLEGDRDLTGLVRFHREHWTSPLKWAAPIRSVRAVRAMKFDWVIDLQGLARSGAFAWLSGANLAIGIELQREAAHGFYDIAVPRPSPDAHAVDWYLAVLRALDVPVHWNFEWLPARPEIAAAVRQRIPADAARLVALVPGARWENKRWPVGNFADLARQLAARDPAARFVILGSRGDAPLGEAIHRAAPGRCRNLAGQTTLPEMVEWLRCCDAVVTNDTGPMHIAAALRKPVVSLFGPTSPARTGPYGQLGRALRHPLPCAPCMKSDCSNPRALECLHAVTPDRVCGAVLALAVPDAAT